MSPIIKRLAREKFITKRGGFLVQGPIILFVGSVSIQEKLALIGVSMGVLPIMFVLVLIVWFAGWLDWKLGLMGEEHQFVWRHMKKEDGNITE